MDKTGMTIKGMGFMARMWAKIYCPHAEPVIELAESAAGTYFADVEDRRKARRIERLEAFAARIERRMKAEDAAKVPPDLFEEILSSAIEDEDKTKIPYYAALVELVAKPPIDSYVVRLLAGALKQLTRFELDVFNDFAHQRQARKQLPTILAKAMKLRLEGLGLVALPDVTMAGSNYATELGCKLLELCNIAHDESK
jgi:hypothetical protein